jgi:hypothetical protein
MPVFPVGHTEYILVCLPAFSPDHCIHEEENGKASAKLRELHLNAKQSHEEETLYHRCQASLWKNAVVSETKYFPPMFHKDGLFTHVTAVPQRLITTATHFILR